ncbi:hypothetical protein MRX96_002764 [Rhipicephalus microplus]
MKGGCYGLLVAGFVTSCCPEAGGVFRWERLRGRCWSRGRTGERVRHGWSEPRYRRDPDSGGPRSARGSSRALGSLQGCGAQRSRSARSIALLPTPGVAQGCLSCCRLVQQPTTLELGGLSHGCGDRREAAHLSAV